VRVGYASVTGIRQIAKAPRSAAKVLLTWFEPHDITRANLLDRSAGLERHRCRCDAGLRVMIGGCKRVLPGNVWVTLDLLSS